MRILCCIAVLLFAAAVGCGTTDNRMKVYPVTGKVTVKGQPAAGARVTFFPSAADAAEKNLPIPSAETNQNGEFTLQSYVPDDGAAEGDYKVTIVWPEPPPPNALGVFEQRDRLGGRFADPNKSKLTAHVDKGGGEIPAFELQ